MSCADPLPPVRTLDRLDAPLARHPVTVVLDRLRSAHNAGNIFRLAEVLGLDLVATCGYTAAPGHPKLARTARGCELLVPHEHFPTALDAVRALKARGRRVYGVETADAAACLWEARFAFPAAFVLGNEALGVEPAALAECDGLVRLPVFGRKNSLNVSNCAAVVLYAAVGQCAGRAAPSRP